MENRTDILNELRELSPFLAEMEKLNVFKVPAGYFEHLSSDILVGIITDNAPDKSFTGDVPAGYFDSLANNILAKIQARQTSEAVTEIQALSPLLRSVQQKQVFEVPQGYFENLSAGVLASVHATPKVVTMQRRSNNFFKYVVAAAFTGMMALSVFKFTGNQKEAALPGYVKEGQKIQDVDQELAKISDDDIVKYLEENGTDVKTAMVANSIDNNELPSQEDYLIDEKTLDNYLNSINVNDLKN